MEGFRKERTPTEGKGEQDDIQWITVNGAHIPIKEGQNKRQVIENFSKKGLKKERKRGIIELPKKEYAELCSAIRTKYANKIPKSGGIFYNNYYYVYNYGKLEEKITCVRKIKIQGNENLINRLEGYSGKTD